MASINEGGFTGPGVPVLQLTTQIGCAAYSTYYCEGGEGGGYRRMTIQISVWFGQLHVQKAYRKSIHNISVLNAHRFFSFKFWSGKFITVPLFCIVQYIFTFLPTHKN